MAARTKAAAEAPPSERRTSSRIAAQPSKVPPQGTSSTKAAPTKRKAETAAAEASDAKKATSVKASNGGTAAKPEDPKAAEAVAMGDAGLSTAKSQLQVGDWLPEALILKDEEGNDFKIGGLKKTVIFLYPKANTPGCKAQACLYRDNYSSWQEIGYEVYGLSNDNVTPLKNWKEKEHFPFKLLSDPSRALIKRLTGIHAKTVRSHVVIDSQGKLVDVSVGVKPAESSNNALASAKKAH